MHIVVAPQALWSSALRLLHATEPVDPDLRAEQLRQLLARGELDPQGFFVAERSGAVVGAILGQVLQGHLGVAWTPQLVASEPDETAVALLRQLATWARDQSVNLLQAVVDPRDGVAGRRLAEAGFEPLATLHYLVAATDTCSLPRTDSLVFVSADGGHGQEFQTIVEQTYEATRDCPRLDHVRRIEDVLDGYRAAGVFRPDWWYLVGDASQGGRAVGCLILADHPESAQAELVYMGLVPSARGQRWGHVLVHQAMWVAYSAGRRQMVVAVDQENIPALAAYRAAGFHSWIDRAVWMKSLH